LSSFIIHIFFSNHRDHSSPLHYAVAGRENQNASINCGFILVGSSL